MRGPLPLRLSLAAAALIGPLAYLLVPRWGTAGLVILTVTIGVSCLMSPGLRLHLPRPALIWLTGFSAVCALSAAWAVMPGRSLNLTLSLTGLLFCWILCTSNIPAFADETTGLRRLQSFGLLLLFAAATFEFLTDGFLTRHFRNFTGGPGHWYSHEASRGLAYGLTLLGPVLAACLMQRQRAMPAILLGATCAAVLAGNHAASKLALVACLVLLAAGYLQPRLAIWLFFGSLALVTLAMPAISNLLFNPASPPAQFYTLDTLSVYHRLAIWRHASDAINIAGPFGLGLDGFRFLPSAPVDYFGTIYNLVNLHPHNIALLVRVELGWPGMLLLLTLYAGIARLLWLRHQQRLFVGGALAAIGVFALYLFVSFSPWQNWLLSAMGMAALFSVALLQPERTREAVDC